MASSGVGEVGAPFHPSGMTRGTSRPTTLGRNMRSPTEPAEGGLALTAAPDYFEPLVAWRVWAVERDDGVARLRSLYRPSIWPVGVPVRGPLPVARLPALASYRPRGPGVDLHLRHLRGPAAPHPEAWLRAAAGVHSDHRPGLALGRRHRVRARLARGLRISRSAVRPRRVCPRPGDRGGSGATTVSLWSCSTWRAWPRRSTPSRGKRHERHRSRDRSFQAASPALVADPLVGPARGRDRRGREPARLGHQGLVPPALEHGHDDLGGVADRRDPPDDRADLRDRVRVVLDPPLRLPRADEVARHPRRLRRVGRAERDPAGQHRHARLPDHGHRPARDRLRRRPRRVRRGEDLLHRCRRLRLPLSLPPASAARSTSRSAGCTSTGPPRSSSSAVAP